jgi:PilZ domain
MDQPEQRRSERILLSIPIRVIGLDTSGEDFTEDTKTLVVNHGGARIALQHKVAADDSVRIINLENYNEADFRIVGPTRLAGQEVAEWGVECSDAGRNIWGIELSPPLSSVDSEAGALLECRACQTQGFWSLTLMEVEVLNSTGAINRKCTKCNKTTYWTYADVSRRPREFPPGEPVAPAPREADVKKGIEKRREKRMGMKLPIMVKNERGEQEATKTENISKGGLAVSLAMDLMEGDKLSVVCPYTPGSQDIPQKAEVRRRATFPFGGKRLYGIRVIRG